MKSGLTEKECIRLGRELKKGRFKKLKKMGMFGTMKRTKVANLREHKI
ncbi:MAG: hypothetical protein JTT12_05410 [Candidatus Brockarchaeota archaeon]|nr:hypothetical protein [Candidatus Brockarchaeota archaeon]